MRFFLRSLGAALSGLALALCFAPFDEAWLVWAWLLILLPLLWTTKPRRSRLRGFGLAYLGGFVFWSINLKWIGTVAGAGVFALAIWLAIFFGLFGAFAASAGNPWRSSSLSPVRGVAARFRQMGRSVGYATLLGGAWCGMEWLRGHLLSGFPWNGLGVTFAESFILAQNAEFVGVIGLAFLPVFFSAICVQTAVRFWQQARNGEVKLIPWDFAFGLLVIMAAFTVGAGRLTEVAGTPKTDVRVLVVQQDIPQVAGRPEWTPEQIVDGFVELTEEAFREVDEIAAKKLQQTETEDEFVDLRGPDLVVWPEACLPEWFAFEDGAGPRAGPAMESVLDYVTSLRSFHFITGVNTFEGESPLREEAKIYNSLMLESPTGERQVYAKHHLVYFGETLPPGEVFREIYEKTAGVPFGGGITAGSSFDPLALQVRKKEIGVIPSICFEDTIARVTRRFVRAEPQVIVNITNDGWFQKSEAAKQHFRNAIFRCIELRRPMVRCANRGVSAVVTATGSTVDPVTRERRTLVDDEGSHFHRGYLLASVYVPEEAGVTLYAAFGDWFAVTGLLGALLWAGYHGFCCWRMKSVGASTETS